MPSVPAILALSNDAGARTAPAAIRFPFQFQMHQHLLVAFAPQEAVAS